MIKYITSGRRAMTWAAALLLLGTIACSNQGDAPSIFAPITNLLGLSSANSAFSNDLTDPVTLPADVAVTQPPQSNAGDAPIRGIIAMTGARLGRGSRVDADVSVLGTEHHRELVLHKYSRIEANRTARADSIRLRKRAKILGTAEYNTIHLGKHASVTNQVTPLGALPLLPPFLSGTPGSQRIGYQDSPLAAGNYGKLRLRKRKTLVLTGGIYHFSDVRLSRKSSLICETTCVVLVKHRLRAGKRSNISAMSRRTSDLIFFVEGEAHYHHGCPHQHHTGVRLRHGSNTTADIYAPNGKFRIGRRASYTGNIIAKRVVVGRGARVATGEDVPRRVAKLFKVGEAGVIEIPGEIRLEIPACALSEDTVISITPGPELFLTPPFAPVGFVTKGPSYELGPDGLQFNCAVSLQQNYDAAAFASAGVDESNLKLFTGSAGRPVFAAPGTVDEAANRIDASITHFSFAVVGTAPAGLSVFPWDLVLRGDFAYAAYFGNATVPGPNEGLRIFNIADPAAPALVGSFSPSGIGSAGLALDGNNAFLVDLQFEPANTTSALRAIDISNPAAPFQVSATPKTPAALNSGFAAKAGNRIYSLCVGPPGPASPSSICIWDITNPAVPVFVIETAPFITSGTVSAIRASGNLLFIPVSGSPPYPSGVSAIHTFDLTDPDNPTPADTHVFAGGGATLRMRLEGNRIYVTRDGGMAILTFDAAGIVTPAGAYANPGQFALSLDVRGNRVVLAAYDTTPVDPANPTDLIVLDVTDAANITEAGRLRTPVTQMVRMNETHAFVLASGVPEQLLVVELPDTAQACKSLPATWTMNQTAPTAASIAYSCTSSGLNYACIDQGAVLPAVDYDFSSVAAANLGNLDAPVVASFTSGGFRGTRISIVPGLDLDYTLDAGNRLTGIASAPVTATFGNYDPNGFPQSITGTSNGTYNYTYGAGGTIPTQTQIVLNGLNSTLDYSGGFMTAWSINNGFTVGTTTTAGSVLICDPPPPTTPTVSPSFPIATNTYSSRPGNICWNGSQYLVTWQGMPFTTPAKGRFLDANANLVGGEFNVTTSGHVGTFYSLACNANQFALAWAKNDVAPHSVRLQLLDSAGSLVGGENIVATPPAGQNVLSSVDLATDGTNFYLAWEEFLDISNVTVRGRLVNNAGSPLGAVASLTAPKFSIGGVSVVSDGTNYLTTYADFTNGLFSRRLDGAGNPVGAPILLRSQPSAVGPSHWNGTHYLNTSTLGVDIVSQVVNPDGTLGLSETLTGISPGVPSMAWNGSDYLMVFVNFINSPDFEIHGQRYDSAGQLVGSPFVIASGPGNRANVRVASNGSDFLVTWDNRTTRVLEAAVVTMP